MGHPAWARAEPDSHDGAPAEYVWYRSANLALVTDRASGIGAAVARRLADRNAGALEATVATLAAAGAWVRALALDVTDGRAVQSTVGRIGQKLGPLRLLVNSAGIAGDGAPMGQVSAADWNRVMAVNLDGAFHAMNAAFPVMAAAEGGVVLNVASVRGVVAAARFACYTASKHALIGLTRSAVADGAALGTRVNSVGPGFIDPPMQEGRMDAARRRQIAGLHLFARWGAADEVAAPIVWLLSDEAAFITGSHRAVDGGYTAI